MDVLAEPAGSLLSLLSERFHPVEKDLAGEDGVSGEGLDGWALFALEGEEVEGLAWRAGHPGGHLVGAFPVPVRHRGDRSLEWETERSAVLGRN